LYILMCDHVGQDRALEVSSDDGVALPVADAAFFSDDGGPLGDVHAAGDQAAPGVSAFAPVVFLAAMAQMAPKAAAVSLVLPDVPVDAFATDKGASLPFQPAADLIGAPLFSRQFFLDLADEAGLHFARRARCGGAPGGRFLLRLYVAIPLAAGIASEFPRDCRAMDAEQLRNLDFGASAFQERVNLAAFVIGQVT
jgi:hypothetical protein